VASGVNDRHAASMTESSRVSACPT
jgi:hypothetical protein